MNEDRYLDSMWESRYDMGYEPDENDQYDRYEPDDDEGEYCDVHKMWHDGQCDDCEREAEAIVRMQEAFLRLIQSIKDEQ